MQEAQTSLSRPASVRSPCYAFINEVLQKTLPSQVLEEQKILDAKVTKDLPGSHLYTEMIPYHYFLIAKLLQKGEPTTFWKARKSIEEVRPGDIFITIDPAYDPDPKARAEGEPAGTHMGFVESLQKGREDLQLCMIDWSTRQQGRTRSLQDLPERVEGGGVAYSFLSLTLTTPAATFEQALWTCKFKGQSRVLCKHVGVLGVDLVQ